MTETLCQLMISYNADFNYGLFILLFPFFVYVIANTIFVFAILITGMGATLAYLAVAILVLALITAPFFGAYKLIELIKK